MEAQVVRVADAVDPARQQIMELIAIAVEAADLVVENVPLERELVGLAAEIGAEPGLPAAKAVVEHGPELPPRQILAIEIMAVDADRALGAQREAVTAADIPFVGAGRAADQPA